MHLDCTNILGLYVPGCRRSKAAFDRRHRRIARLGGNGSRPRTEFARASVARRRISHGWNTDQTRIVLVKERTLYAARRSSAATRQCPAGFREAVQRNPAET